jgi:Zn finger protein HypA/HybF involved in hydrogenase expression
MIAPPPYKLKCPKCGYSEVVKPKSDVLNPTDILRVCPKCNTKMEKVEMNILEEVIAKMSC